MKMKSAVFRGTRFLLFALVFPITFYLEGLASAENIDPGNNGSQYPFSENTGWLNAEPFGNGGSGLAVTTSSITGFLWGENIGWISLSCINTASCGKVNYGVRNDGAGNLSGYAWGENVGWINFGPVSGGVTIDPCGGFSGRAWGENIGWITFSSDAPVPYKVETFQGLASDTGEPSTSVYVSGAGWTNKDISITLSAIDNGCGSGVKELRYTLDSNPEVVTAGSSALLNVSVEGIHSLKYFSKDNANNSEVLKNLSLMIDKTLPVVNIISPSNGANFSINNSVITDFTATDALSGIAGVLATAPDGSPVDTSTAGTKSFFVTATDEAGNSKTVTYSYSVFYPGNIDTESNGAQYVWGENVGWFNMKPSWGPGVTVTDTEVNGYVWNENVGWINLSPALHGGVLNDGTGVLSGYAWGENVGWINFAPTGGGVSIDLAGKFNGYAWGENIGWISFSSSGPVSYSTKTGWTPPDTTPPDLQVPANIIAEATSPAGAAVFYNVSATDNTDPAPTVSCDLVSGGIFSLGSSIVTCTATDALGNSSSTAFMVIVQDATPPTVTPPANITLYATEVSGTRGSFLTAFLSGGSAVDSVDPAPNRMNPQVAGVDADSSTLFPVGTTVVTFRFRDLSGNVGTATATVTVTVGQPRLSGIISAKGRNSSGEFYLDLTLTNTGTGIAQNIMLTKEILRTLSGTGTVTATSPALPYAVGTLNVGASTVVRLYLTVPSTVIRFSIMENGTMKNILGTNYTFALGQSVIP